MNSSKEIDKIFFNSETNAPFTNCLVCQSELLESDSNYLIEKVFRKVPNLGLTEVLFEYAICMDCARRTHNQMSVESIASVEAFFHENVKHQVIQMEQGRLNHCLFTGRSLDLCSEYSLHAQCKGNKMTTSIFPYALSDEAMDNIADILSAATLDELDRFKSENFGVPPELEDIMNTRRLLPF